MDLWTIIGIRLICGWWILWTGGLLWMVHIVDCMGDVDEVDYVDTDSIYDVDNELRGLYERLSGRREVVGVDDAGDVDYVDAVDRGG